MKRILKHLLFTVFALFMFYLLTRTLQHSHEEYYGATDSYIFSKGNAPEDVREEIIRLLNKFQEGYTERDTSRIEPFMQQLFAEENLLVLGTMPNEICIGRKEAKRLVFSDWKGWGDCKFMMDIANVSAYGNVAWISTIGFVKFDLSRFLVLPLRLTAVIVREDDLWKFRQMQFQFDLDLSFMLVTIIAMIIWSVISMMKLAVVVIQSVKKQKNIQHKV
ncbi:MAG: nuclear transport factor 2 family protein [Bacteroidales bacterium]|nr:MAG: nuclear transport factor 2 family protein [Bacteroidales bacterium]